MVIGEDGSYSAVGPEYELDVSGHLVAVDSRMGNPMQSIQVSEAFMDSMAYPDGIAFEKDGFVVERAGVVLRIRTRVTVLKQGREIRISPAGAIP